MTDSKVSLLVNMHWVYLWCTPQSVDAHGVGCGIRYPIDVVNEMTKGNDPAQVFFELQGMPVEDGVMLLLNNEVKETMKDDKDVLISKDTPVLRRTTTTADST